MPEIANQTWDAGRYASAGAFVPVLGLPVVDLLAPLPGERILDLGCGNGDLAEKIAAAGATVVAVDAAPDLIAASRARGLDARLMDGQNLDLRPRVRRGLLQCGTALDEGCGCGDRRGARAR